MATSWTNNGEWERVKGKDDDDTASNAVKRLAYCEFHTLYNFNPSISDFDFL